jgi:outer membrane autotransporter protein
MSVRNLSAGLIDGKFDGQSDNVNGSVSYLIPFANNYFIEPTANLSYTRSTFNNLQVATGLAGSQMLTFNTVYSLLGRAGARVGTSFVYGGFNWTPFGVALVLNEFNKNAAGTFVAGAGTPFGLETNRVGTFGQASAGIAMTSLTSGWLAFVRGDLKFGQRLDGAAVLGGARYTFGPI